MNEQQITDFMMSTTKDIAALWESMKSAHKRIDQMSELTASVNKLGQEVGRVAEKVEYIAERMNKTVERMEQGQKEQGIRIGNTEKTVLEITQNKENIKEHEKRLDEIDKAPADKWNKLIWMIITGVVTAIVAFCMGRLL